MFAYLSCRVLCKLCDFWNFVSSIAILSYILSTWTFKRPPTYLAWTIVDIWLTTHPPHLVHVVCEWPLMDGHTVTLSHIHSEYTCSEQPTQAANRVYLCCFSLLKQPWLQLQYSIWTHMQEIRAQKFELYH